MSILQETGRNLHFHLILLADSLPCSWDVQARLLGGRMDAQWLASFRSQTVLFDPIVQTTFRSSESVFTIGKRVRAISFSPQPRGGHSETLHSRWQAQLIPPFEASPRLVLDFEADDASKVEGMVQVLAYRMGAEVLVPSSRSYASTKQCRRRSFQLHLDKSLPNV